ESPKEKAKQVEASKRTELALGKAGIAKRPPAQRFADYADNWIETYVKSHCKHSTIRGYKLVLETHLKTAFSGKRLDEITRQDILVTTPTPCSCALSEPACAWASCSDCNGRISISTAVSFRFNAIGFAIVWRRQRTISFAVLTCPRNCRKRYRNYAGAERCC